MPSTIRHIAQATKNEAFAMRLAGSADEPQAVNWAVVVLFYAALHLVDAYLDSAAGHHPKNHFDRSKWVAREKALKAIEGQYSELKSRSEDVRYNCLALNPKSLEVEFVQMYQPLKAHIVTLLHQSTSDLATK